MGTSRSLTPRLAEHDVFRMGPLVQVEALWLKMTAGRARRVVVLLLAVGLLNVFDLLMTIRASRDGMLHEENPLARVMLGHSVAILGIFKIAVVCAGSYVLFRCRRFRCAEIASCLVCTVYTGVALQWRLCYRMYEIAITGGDHASDMAKVDRLLELVPTL